MDTKPTERILGYTVFFGVEITEYLETTDD